jgi:hypothetical protein
MLKFMAHFKVDSHRQVGRSGVVEGKRVAATREKMPEQIKSPLCNMNGVY